MARLALKPGGAEFAAVSDAGDVFGFCAAAQTKVVVMKAKHMALLNHRPSETKSGATNPSNGTVSENRAVPTGLCLGFPTNTQHCRAGLSWFRSSGAGFELHMPTHFLANISISTTGD